MFRIGRPLCFTLPLLAFLVEELSRGDVLSFSAQELAKIDEIMMLQGEFLARIGNTVEVEESYQAKSFQDARKRLSGAGIEESQYFLYVDRNPECQFVFVCFFDAEKGKIIEVGRDKVSTGNSKKGRDYFLTPIGVFRNTIAVCGYRALGTKNKWGWRGLGKKGSRVWDFGWQEGYKKIDASQKEMINIRLLLHATDPDYGEKRLGKPDSKGCIRISGQLNKFLDHFGILDKDYERHNHSLLKKDRGPVIYQGEYLIVGDSSGFEQGA